MNLADTGQIFRNFSNSLKVKAIINRFLDSDGKFLDYAGGYGVFTRIMRDFGLNFYWEDPFTKNLFAEGFNSDPKIQFYEAITVFECFEHWENPIEEIKQLLERTSNIIFTTNLISKPAPLKWWYYGLDHGQHVSFFSKDSLEFLSKKFNCNYYSKNGIHIFSRTKYSRFSLLLTLFKVKLLLLASGYNSKRSLTSHDHFKLIQEN